MNRLKRFIVVLFYCTVSQAVAEIISGTNFVQYNHDITFSPYTDSENEWDSTTHGSDGSNLVYTCSAPSVSEIDFFVAEEQVGVCTYICHALAIGSPRPFYLSKIQFGEYDFSQELRLDATAEFIKIDTVTIDTHTKYVDSVNCYLPHIIIDDIDDNGYEEYTDIDFGIFKNRDGNCILITFTPVFDISFENTGLPDPAGHTYLKGYEINWFLQNDGSLEFDDITHAFPRKGPSRSVNPHKNETVYYGINGRRINGSAPLASTLIISRNGRKLITQLRKKAFQRNMNFSVEELSD